MCVFLFQVDIPPPSVGHRGGYSKFQHEMYQHPSFLYEVTQRSYAIFSTEEALDTKVARVVLSSAFLHSLLS